MNAQVESTEEAALVDVVAVSLETTLRLFEKCILAAATLISLCRSAGRQV